MSYGTPESASAARKLLERDMSVNSVSKKVLFCVHLRLMVLRLLASCIVLSMNIGLQQATVALLSF